MTKYVKHIVAIALLIILPLNLAGLTIFSHVCSESGVIASNLLQKESCNEFDAESSYGQDDCSDELTGGTDTCCGSIDSEGKHCEIEKAQNRENQIGLSQLPCCSDESKVILIDLPFINQVQETYKSLTNICFVGLITYSDLSFKISESNKEYKEPDIINDQQQMLVKYIHIYSSSKTDHSA